MKKALSLFTALLFLSGMAFAQNESEVDQTGDGNTATVGQTGTNDAQVIQETVGESGNTATINQSTSNFVGPNDGGDFTWGEYGAFVDQYGEGNIAGATQAGVDNYVSIEQGSTTDYPEEQTDAPAVSNEAYSWQEGDGNYSTFEQGGADNMADFYIVGDNNETILRQALTGVGGNNTSLLQINGSYNHVLSNQRGEGNRFEGFDGDDFMIEGGVVENGNTVDAWQHGGDNVIKGDIYGDGNTAFMQQAGDDHDIELEVDGDNNSATVYQYGEESGWTEIREIGKKAGEDNNAYLSQEGTYNTLMVEQKGEGNDAMIDQIGSGNNADLWQNGDDNEADIDQDGSNSSFTYVNGDLNYVKHNQYGEDGDGSDPGTNHAGTQVLLGGVDNHLEIEQEGQGNIAYHTVAGGASYNEAYTEQDGMANVANVVQYSDDNYARTVQDAWNGGEKVFGDNEAHGNVSNILQMGSTENSAESYQYGDLNNSYIWQNGSNNNAVVDQGLWDQRYPVLNSHGSSNISTIMQNGDWNNANVLQNGDGNISTIMQSN